MKRRTLLTGATAALATTPLARPHAQKAVTIRWWYHFDDPKATPDALIAAFEKANPDIHVEAENIPWGGGGDYDNRLYTSLIAGNGPDVAMVKFVNQARLLEMEALLPLDTWIDAWPGKSDISNDVWRLHMGPDGKRYYLPLQYVVLYLYVRQDWLAQKNLKLPTTFPDFLAAAEATTGDNRWGFGLRGGSGGHDFWATFVLGNGAKIAKGGLTSPQALAANQWFIDLYRAHHVCPPSAPTDAFLQTINNMKAGRTAMTIHHIGSANELTAALGDAITAVPVPRGTNGPGWATYGDGSVGCFRRQQEPRGGVEMGLRTCPPAQPMSRSTSCLARSPSPPRARRTGMCSRNGSSRPRRIRCRWRRCCRTCRRPRTSPAPCGRRPRSGRCSARSVRTT